MAKLESDKSFIDKAIQDAVNDIKQNYMPLSVIDDIKAEIEQEYASCCICEINENYKFDEYGVSEYCEVDNISGVLEIIDAKVKEYQKVGG